ncbi:MAG: hypothetical protein P8Z79_22690 [Sedimentisphaerales bacterium]
MLYASAWRSLSKKNVGRVAAAVKATWELLVRGPAEWVLDAKFRIDTDECTQRAGISNTVK